MKELFPVALHKAILGVDIEGFADRRRTNPDQILAREGLYCCLQAGLPGRVSPGTCATAKIAVTVR